MDLVVLDVISRHVGDDIVEKIPENLFLPLNESLTQDEYDAVQLKKKQEEEVLYLINY